MRPNLLKERERREKQRARREKRQNRQRGKSQRQIAAVLAGAESVSASCTGRLKRSIVSRSGMGPFLIHAAATRRPEEGASIDHQTGTFGGLF